MRPPDYKLDENNSAFFFFFFLLSCYPFSFKQNIPFSYPGENSGEMASGFKQERWGGGEMSHSCRKQGDSNPANLKAKVGFSILQSPATWHVCDLFVSLASFLFLSSSPAEATTFVSWEVLGSGFASALTLLKKDNLQKCSVTPPQRRRKESQVRQPLPWRCKGRSKQGFTLGFRLLRLWPPFPSAPLCLLINKQAGAVSAVQRTGLPACPSSSRLPTYLPARSQPPVLASWHSWHSALLSLLKLQNSHLENSEAMLRPVTVNYIIHYEALSSACESRFCQTHG